MEFNSLKAFLAVADSASFTEASERLFLTQPAVSKRIAALEQELGAPLFDRIQRRVELTEAGHALLPHARAILRQMEESRRAVADLSGEVSGELRLGTSHHIGLHRLPPILRAFNQEHPQVDLDIHFYDSEEACREVAHGNLALGITTLPAQLEGPLEQRVIWDDPLAVIVASDNPLANTHADIQALIEQPAIFPSRKTYTRQLIDKALSQLGVAAKVRLETNYLETIKMMVSVGMGWSILPRSMLDEGVAEVTVQGLALRRKLGVVTHRQRSLSNAAQALLALLSRASQQR